MKNQIMLWKILEMRKDSQFIPYYPTYKFCKVKMKTGNGRWVESEIQKYTSEGRLIKIYQRFKCVIPIFDLQQ